MISNVAFHPRPDKPGLQPRDLHLIRTNRLCHALAQTPCGGSRTLPGIPAFRINLPPAVRADMMGPSFGEGLSMTPAIFALARLAVCVFAISASLSPLVAQEAYPSRIVRIIIPFPAGSALDSLTRMVAEHLNKGWGGKGVIVENVPGAGGNVGTQRFARADPDGYTLLASPPGPLTLNKLLYKDTNYDAARFVPVSLLASVPNVLVVRNDVPVKTFQEFIAYAAAHPGKLNYASQGLGSTGYLTARSLEVAAKIQMVHVPYRGAAMILTDLTAGHVDSFFDTATTSVPLHQGGKARVLAVAGTARLAALPDLPAIAEFVPGFRSITWFGLAAPEGTPLALASKISADAARVIASPEVSQRLREQHMTPGGTSVADTGKFFEDERALWTKLIRDIGHQAE